MRGFEPAYKGSAWGHQSVNSTGRHIPRIDYISLQHFVELSIIIQALSQTHMHDALWVIFHRFLKDKQTFKSFQSKLLSQFRVCERAYYIDEEGSPRNFSHDHHGKPYNITYVTFCRKNILQHGDPGIEQKGLPIILPIPRGKLPDYGLYLEHL